MATATAERTRLNGAYHSRTSQGHIRPCRPLCGRQFDARSQDARQRDRAARVGRRHADRTGCVEYRETRSAGPRAGSMPLDEIRVVNFPGRRRREDHERRRQGPNGARATHFRRQRRHLLLAEVATPHRRHDRHGRRRSALRARNPSSAAGWRPAQRRCQPCPLSRWRRAAGASHQSVSGPGRAGPPSSARSRCLTVHSRTESSKLFACRSRVALDQAAPLPSEPLAPSSPSIICK